MSSIPKSERKHIVFIGKRNAGKSSLVNAFANQELSIVSDIAGTTTDPVSKSMELLPFGPVVLVDTAGYDDESPLGSKRIEKTRKALSMADYVLLILPSNEILSLLDAAYIKFLAAEKLPFSIVITKADLPDNSLLIKQLQEHNLSFLKVNIFSAESITILRNTVSSSIPKEVDTTLAGDLIKQGDVVVLVTPIDLGAPKGRLILPQVQTIRDSLDSSAITLIVKDKELRAALDVLKFPPALVICDSQAIMRVNADVSPGVKLTTFSILMARHKGDLRIFMKGVKIIDKLQNGDKVLIAEACTHHAQEDDIGKIKIPRWLNNYLKKNLQFEFASGMDFPENLNEYKLIIHCGSCMLTRKMMLSRLKQAAFQNIPIVNYGMLISYIHGAFPRAIEIFPDALDEWKSLD